MSDTPFEALDALFEAQGLEAKPAPQHSGRTWKGRRDGREISVVCSLRTRTKYHGESMKTRQYAGHEFLIEATTTLQTRLTLNPRVNNALATWLDRLLLKRLGLHRFDPPASGYAHLKLAAYEPSWAVQFLAEEHVLEVLNVLLPEDELNQTVALQPGFVLARSRRHLSEITPDFASRQLDAVLDLAHLAETLPAPSQIATPTRIETYARHHPKQFAMLLFVGLLVGVLAVSAVVIPLLFAIAYFQLQGYLLLAGFGGWWWWRKKKKQRTQAEVASA